MRQLPTNLGSALFDGQRQPAYQMLAYDSTVDTIGAVVTGTAAQTPFDLTPYLKGALSWTSDQINFTLGGPASLFNPDTGSARAFLADTAILRLREGDARVPKSDWVNTFTGQIKGQVGWDWDRGTQTLEAQVTGFSRDNTAALKRRLVTSENYTVGTEVGVFLRDILHTFFGLQEAEIRLPQTLGLQLLHQTNQVCQMAPWDAANALLQAVCLVPCFDGDGRFTAYAKNMHRPPDRVLADYSRVLDYQIPARTQDYINMVVVTFLDSVLTEVDSPYQKLGDAQVTTGFFTMGEKLPVWWSKDHSQRATGTSLRIIKSVNAGLLPVGTESYRQIDEFHGEIDVAIKMWVPLLATVMLGEYVAAAFFPDGVPAGQPVQVAPVEGTGITIPNPAAAAQEVIMAAAAAATCGASVPPPPGAISGWTIPWGKVIQAQAMASITLIMMCLGSAQYEIWGMPYDYAYLKLQSTAIEDGLNYWDENPSKIDNDFLGSYEQADAVSLTELIWQKSSAYPRQLTLADDLALERGDIVEIPDGRKFCITDMSKSIQRGQAASLILKCIKVMTP